MPVKLWICFECGVAHVVSPIVVGTKGQCRKCGAEAKIVDHRDNLDAQAWGTELRRQAKAKKLAEAKLARR